MDKPLAELLKRTIAHSYKLPREKRCWTLEENKKQVQIHVPNRHSFAFKLDPDNTKKQPFAFFGDSPPHGVAKMCDAILACHYKEYCYLFLIEMKTKNEGDYKDQLENGRLFCNWLVQLYLHYEHFKTPPVFISTLIWSPKRPHDKESTDHSSGYKYTAAKQNFKHSFKIENTDRIIISKLIECIPGKNPQTQSNA